MSSCIFALTVLENPRQIPDSKFVVFDAQIWLGGETPTILGCLKYFNASNLPFEEVGYYMVYAYVVRMEKGTTVYSTETKDMDYQFVGDISTLIPLPFSDEDINSTTDRPAVFDPKHRGFVSFSGVATNVDEKTTEFDVKADQWVSAYKDVKDVRPVFPAHCTFPDSPRYRKGKPPVKNSRFVHVFGYLVGVQKDTAGMVTGFEISVDNVTFLGHHIPVAPAALQTDSAASPSPVGKRKLKGSFSFGESPSAAAKRRKLGPSQAQNVSPSIAQSVSSK